VALTLDHLQQREEHWAIVYLVGKGGHVRTVPVPDWVRTELDDWLAAAAIDRGKLFRRVNKAGRTWRCSMASLSSFAIRTVAVAIALFNSSLCVIIFSALDSRQVPYFGTGAGV